MHVARSALVALLVAPLAVVASCGVGDLDLTGKQCPCVGGYVCDLPTNTCVFGLNVEGGVLSDSAAPDDAFAQPESNPSALIGVTGLVAAWRTPNVVRWEWRVTGKAADWRSYTIVVASSPADITNGTGQVLGKIDQPELAAFDARSGKLAGPVVIWTATSAKPNTTRYARVEVKDVKGQSNFSAIVIATTPAAATSFKTIFDGNTARSSRPVGQFDFVAGQNAHIFHTDCGAGPSPCAETAELFDLQIDLNKSGAFSQADFDKAFLDVKIDGNVAAGSLDSTVALEPGSGTCTGLDCRYAYKGWTQSTAPASSLTVLQVPLSKMVDGNGAAMQFATLQQKSFLIAVLAFSGTWKQNNALRLLDARIRW